MHVKNNLWESVISLHYVGPRDGSLSGSAASSFSRQAISLTPGSHFYRAAPFPPTPLFLFSPFPPSLPLSFLFLPRVLLCNSPICYSHRSASLSTFRVSHHAGLHRLSYNSMFSAISLLDLSWPQSVDRGFFKREYRLHGLRSIIFLLSQFCKHSPLWQSSTTRLPSRHLELAVTR